MAAVAPATYAADATTTISIDFPTVLVMYHYDTIELAIADSALADLLSGGTSVACATSDFCDDLGTKDLTVTDEIAAFTTGAATVDADVASDVSALAATTGTVTVENAVGVRALGCSTYAASAVEGGSSTGVTVNAGAINGIDGEACTLGLTTGDLSFDIDFETVAGNTADAVFDVTITGT